MGMTKAKAKTMLTHLWLLLWKNLLVRRRRLFSLFWEFVGLILIGTICIYFWDFHRRKIEPEYGEILERKKELLNYSYLIPEFFPEPSYQEKNVTEIKVKDLRVRGRFIAYAPSDGPADEIIKILENNTRNWTFVAFPNEDELMAWHTNLTMQEGAAELMWMAIIFNVSKSTTNWSYKLRLVQNERGIGKEFVYQQDLVQEPMPERDFLKDGAPSGDPRNKSRDKEKALFQRLTYEDSGFLGVQFTLDGILAEMLIGEDIFEGYNISVQTMPYPNLLRWNWFPLPITIYVAQYVIPFFLLVPYLVTFVLTVKWIIEEKRSGFKELLNINVNGMTNCMLWVGWLLSTMTIYLIITIALTLIIYCTDLLHNTHSPFALLFVLLFYAINLTSFAFFISTWFQRPENGAQAAFLIFLVSSAVIGAAIDFTGFKNVSIEGKFAGCLVPTGAIYVAAKVIYNHPTEPKQDPNESFHLGHVFFMMILTTFLYSVLTLYLENIVPSKFGPRRSIFYPFTDLWQKIKQIRSKVKDEVNVGEEGSGPTFDGSDDKSFQREPRGLERAVSVKGLTKVYKGNKELKKAVDQVTLNIYKGQITILLGHNGAGKTTLIGMLTGTIQPSKGFASINDHDVLTDLKHARENVSVCPQENLLMDQLTVADHWKMFGRLKGLSKREAKEKSKELAERMELSEKLNVTVDKLSGGQKRKVQLGIAVIGNTEVLFLDGPTSGIDPAARRHVWDLIAELRKDRAIVLTTYHMKEAEVLGDRIAMMAGGKIKCYGSAAYLRKFFGQGFTLKLNISEKEDEPEPGLEPEIKDDPKIEIEENPESENKEGQEPEPLSTRAVKQDPEEENQEPPAKVEEILNVLGNYVAGAKLVSFNRDAEKQECELNINIPILTEDKKTVDVTSKFPGLFTQLEAQKKDLAIISMVLAYANMEDVFERVIEGDKQPDNNAKRASTDSGQKKFLKELEKRAPPALTKRSGFRIVTLSLRRFWALLVKKVLSMYHNKFSWAVQFLIATIIFCLAVVIMGESYTIRIDETYGPIPITLSAYSNVTIMYSSNGSGPLNLNAAFETAVKSGGGSPPTLIDTKNLTNNYRFIAFNKTKLYLSQFVVGATLNQTNLRGYWNRNHYHSEPLVLNLLTNMLLAKKAADKGDTKSYSISVVNHPIGWKNEVKKKAIHTALLYKSANASKMLLDAPNDEDTILQYVLVIVFALLVYFSLAIFISFFVILPVEERLSKVKQVQRMAGAGPLSYFLSFLLCDLVLVLLLSAFLVLLVFIFSEASLYTLPYVDNQGLVILFLIFVMFGVSMIILTYLISLWASSPSSGFVFLMLIQCCAVPLLVAIVAILRLGSTTKLDGENVGFDGFLQIISLAFFPTIVLFYGLERFAMLSVVNRVCQNIYPGVLHAVCAVQDERTRRKMLKKEKLFSLSLCCSNCTGIGSPCFERLPFFSGLAENSITLLLIVFAVQALVFGALLLFIESGWCLVFKMWICKVVDKVLKPSMFLQSTDSDIKEEAERVDEALGSTKPIVNPNSKRPMNCPCFKKTEAKLTDALYVSHLCKSDRKFLTLSELSFGLHYAECLGILGVNGAGKTTLFNIVTGVENPSSGAIVVLGDIGVCPQVNALIDVLTGRQMLNLFYQLRGVNQESVENETQKWLVKMELEKSADEPCGQYSSGMKRKLNAAMALIGSPPILLLNEPTTGVDPHARRQFRKVLREAQTAGQATILTSHSIEECEVLCNRVGVMVNGQMQCLGSVNHLKKKFAHGYTIIILVKNPKHKRPSLLPPPKPVPATSQASAAKVHKDSVSVPDTTFGQDPDEPSAQDNDPTLAEPPKQRIPRVSIVERPKASNLDSEKNSFSDGPRNSDPAGAKTSVSTFGRNSVPAASAKNAMQAPGKRSVSASSKSSGSTDGKSLAAFVQASVTGISQASSPDRRRSSAQASSDDERGSSVKRFSGVSRQLHSKLKYLMHEKFPLCQLQDEDEYTLQYQIKDKTLTLSKIISNMESIKAEDNSLIKKYSVSDTTLEQIFLYFAHQEYPARKGKGCC